jgi:hypothetical protein
MARRYIGERAGGVGIDDRLPVPVGLTGYCERETRGLTWVNRKAVGRLVRTAVLSITFVSSEGSSE